MQELDEKKEFLYDYYVFTGDTGDSIYILHLNLLISFI